MPLPTQPDLASRIESGAARPRWLQIADGLRAEILSGRFGPGVQLPNEEALAARFGVNRHTLRRAVQRLLHEGHVRVVQGSGTFVRELVLDYALQRRTRMTDNLAQAGERAQRELIGHARLPAADWAVALGVRRDARIELLHTRARIRGRPIGLSHTAYPLPRFAGIAEAFRAAGSITGALKSFGVAGYDRASSAVSCRLPSVDEADALARPASEPVLVVRHHSVDVDGVAVEAGQTLFAADAVQLTVRHDC